MVSETITDHTAAGAIPEQGAAPEPENIDEESIVDCLSLHMLSEHGIAGPIHLDDFALADHHDMLHTECDWSHPIDDLRFRPKHALDVALDGRDLDVK